MDYPWSIYGLSMEYLWTFHGVSSMDYLWTIHGVAMKYLWSIYGHFIVYSSVCHLGFAICHLLEGIKKVSFSRHFKIYYWTTIKLVQYFLEDLATIIKFDFGKINSIGKWEIFCYFQCFYCWCIGLN